MMEGTIGVRSTTGAGSTFWFTARFKKAIVSSEPGNVGRGAGIQEAGDHFAPFAAGGRNAVMVMEHPASSGAARHGNESRKTRPIRILVAEDNAINQEVCVRMLQKAGFEASVVENGEEAVHALSNEAFDLVFMDCQMPVMDGYEATGQIRKREQGGKHAVIVAMTANALQGDREKCLAAGMDDYISKPVKQEVLRKTLQKWVATILQFAGGDEGGETPLAGDGESSDAILDRSRFEELASIGSSTQPPLVERIVNRYVEDAPVRVEKLREALREKDFNSLGFAAHKLRGSSAQLGVLAVTKICQQLEVRPFGDSVQEASRLVELLEHALKEAITELIKYLPGNGRHENPHS